MPILQFKKPESPETQQVWACNCGHQAFLLYLGGSIVCANCYAPQSLAHFDPSEGEWE